MAIRIKELDSLRGLASLSVVLFHLTYKFEISKQGFKFGCMGVDLFFIISGFVIFMTIEKCTSKKDFIISRFSRLYPAYWASVSLAALVAFFTVKDFTVFYNIEKSGFLKQYLCNLTMFQYYFNQPDIDATYWTLIIELNFYIFIFLLFAFKLLSKIEWIGFGLLVSILVLKISEEYFYQTGFINILTQKIPLLKYFPLFFSGILFYKIKSNKLTVYRFLLLVLCFITQIYFFTFFYRNNGIISLNEYAIVLSVIYFIFILFTQDMLKIIVNKVNLKLGEISYSLYMNHYLIGANVLLLGLISKGFSKLLIF